MLSFGYGVVQHALVLVLILNIQSGEHIKYHRELNNIEWAVETCK